MKRFLLGLLLSLVTSGAFAQALPVCNWGDMVYRASTGYACLPLDNTPGKFLQGQGASAAPVWTFQAAAGFLLPTQSTNTFLGNTTGGTASPTPNTVSQILDTIGYDVSRPPTVGAILYKSGTAPNNAWQALAPPASSGQVLSSVANAPTWISNSPTLDGFCTAQGAILYRNATVWTCLGPAGVAGQYLGSFGAGANPAWTTINTTTLGAVPTSRLVSTGTGLSGGGDLSADRTLSIASTISAAGPIGTAITTPIITFNAQGQLTTVSSATITPAFSSVTGQATLAQLPTLTANRILGAATAGTPTELTMPSCSAANSALQWVSNTGIQCGTLSAGGTVSGPATSTNTAVPRWSGTGGITLLDSGVLIDGSNNMTGVAALTASGAVSGGSITGAMVASKATQQTGTSATAVVTPSQQQSHDSAAKVIATFTPASTPSVGFGYNVSSVTKAATGNFTVNFTTAFSSTSYACLVSTQTASGAGGVIGFVNSQVAGSVQIFTVNNALSLADPTLTASVACYGRQ